MSPTVPSLSAASESLRLDDDRDRRPSAVPRSGTRAALTVTVTEAGLAAARHGPVVCVQGHWQPEFKLNLT